MTVSKEGIRDFPKAEPFQGIQVSLLDKIYADHSRFPKANQGAQPFLVVQPLPVVEEPSP